MGKFPQKYRGSISVLAGFIYSEATSRVPGTTKIQLIRHQGALETPSVLSGTSRRVPKGCLCQGGPDPPCSLTQWLVLSPSACPTARKGKGLFSLGDINAVWRLQSTGVHSVLREGQRSLFGMLKQEGVTVVSNTVGRLIAQ